MDSEKNIELLQHTGFIKERLAELIDYLRQDIDQIEEPKAKALFETSAEAIAGLEKAFSDYEKNNEDS